MGYSWQSQKERDYCKDEDVDGWTILQWILERWDGMVGTGSTCLTIGTVGGLM
jgi:hypothetical protein